MTPTPAGKLTPTQKAAQIRIQRALSVPGATGPKGFLLWAEAAWPAAISQRILKAAQKYTPGASTYPVAAPTLASAYQGGFGFLGDDSTIAVDYTAIPDSVSAAIAQGGATDAPAPSAVTWASSSQPASNAWVGDIANAVGAATTAYLGVQQVKDAQTIFQTNLSRAQQGLPMIPTNPTTYGLPAPTANIGLAPGTQNVLLIGVGVLAVGLILSGALGGSRRK